MLHYPNWLKLQWNVNTSISKTKNLCLWKETYPWKEHPLTWRTHANKNVCNRKGKQEDLFRSRYGLFRNLIIEIKCEIYFPSISIISPNLGAELLLYFRIWTGFMILFPAKLETFSYISAINHKRLLQLLATIQLFRDFCFHRDKFLFCFLHIHCCSWISNSIIPEARTYFFPDYFYLLAWFN